MLQLLHRHPIQMSVYETFCASKRSKELSLKVDKLIESGKSQETTGNATKNTLGNDEQILVRKADNSAESMTESTLRSKRYRAPDIYCNDVIEEEDSFSSFSHKRVCTAPPPTSESSVLNTISYEYPMNYSSHHNLNTQKEDEENPGEGMDVNDDIVSNFNTISFDTTSNNEMVLSDGNHSAESHQSYPVFSPLKRVGRKIDHLVEDVIRKSSRYNSDHLQLSIPPSDFEFRMPSYVSVAGSPTRDARFLTSPDARDLYMGAMHQATSTPSTAKNTSISTPSMCKPKLIQYHAEQSASSSRDCQLEDSSSSVFSSPPSFHYEKVTHSDWFDNSCSGIGDGNNCVNDSRNRNQACGNNGRNIGNCCSHNSNSDKGAEDEEEEEEEEDCDDMFVDP
jgi:hypothetical protein